MSGPALSNDVQFVRFNLIKNDEKYAQSEDFSRRRTCGFNEFLQIRKLLLIDRVGTHGFHLSLPDHRVGFQDQVASLMQISPELSVQRQLLVHSRAEDVDVVTKKSLVPRVLAPGEEEIVQCVHQIFVIPYESVPVPTSHVTRHSVHCGNCCVHSESNDRPGASRATYFNGFTPGRLKRHG